MDKNMIDKHNLIKELTGFKHADTVYNNLTHITHIDDILVAAIAKDSFFHNINFGTSTCRNEYNKFYDIDGLKEYGAMCIIQYIKQCVMEKSALVADSIGNFVKTKANTCLTSDMNDKLFNIYDKHDAIFIKDLHYEADDGQFKSARAEDGYIIYKGNDGIIVAEGKDITINLRVSVHENSTIKLQLSVDVVSAMAVSLKTMNTREDLLQSFGDSEEIILKCVPRNDKGVVNGISYERHYRWRVDSMYDDIILAIQNHFHNN